MHIPNKELSTYKITRFLCSRFMALKLEFVLPSKIPSCGQSALAKAQASLIRVLKTLRLLPLEVTEACLGSKHFITIALREFKI